MRVIKKVLLVCLLSASLLPLSSCTTTDSTLVDTEAIFFTFIVTSDGDTITARAVLRLGDALGSLLELGEGDNLTVNGIALVERRDVLTNFVEYVADVPEAEEYAFSFTRPDEGPYVSTAEGLDPISVSAPAEDSTISRASNFQVRWTPSGNADEAVIIVSIPCVEFVQAYAGINDGTEIITAESIDIDPTLEDEECSTGEVTVVVERNGDLDPDLNGVITSETRDSVGFTSEP